MEVLQRIFAKPFEVTQYWASDRYPGMQTSAGNTVGRLFKYCPQHVRRYQPAQGGDWYFEVCDGEDGPSGGDFLPRFLPSRRNIAMLNGACIKASHHLAARLGNAGEKAESDENSLFADIVAWHGTGEMELANASYQRDLWQVFAMDWGLELPEPGRFGIDPVTITHRPGLPCAAAMERAVLPVIEAVHGPLENGRQSLSNDGGRNFDVVEYRRTDGQALVQRYDITDVFGRADLDWMYFGF